MKLILTSLIILSVLVIGVSQAEAYEGKVLFSTEMSEPTIGDAVLYKGMLIRSPPEPDITLQVKLSDADGNVIDSMDVDVSTEMVIFEEFEEAWNFEFIIDTSKYNLLTDTRYTVEVIYDDKMDEKRLFVYPTLEQSIIDSGNMKAEKVEPQSLTEEETIPDWVRSIFVFYANNEISDSELINAIQYLIDMKILKV